MKGASQSNWFSGLLALLFALLLFFNANASGNSNGTVTTSQVYDEMVYNVPIKPEYDESKYFISGYEETTAVHLSSLNRIQLNLEANEDTRKFQVVADLTNVGLGTSEVPLRVIGLSSAVTAELETKTITVTIENKATKKFEVEAKLPESFDTEGYKLDSVSITPKTVEITTGEETMAEIARVVAPLTSTEISADTLKQTVNVQALDSNGQVLSIESPAPQVQATVKLSLPKKEVAVRLVSSGSPPADVSSYMLNTSQQIIAISGSNSVLEAIEYLEVPVDISGVRTAVRQKVSIPTSGEFTASPSEIEVTITPIFSRVDVSGASGSISGGSAAESEAEEPASTTTTTSSSETANDEETTETTTTETSSTE